ncbi:hypothetical protein WDJ51_09955 [Rathayibacter sp. YIM 133350]|uniref:hypothetical protein n=1 Tax=Rathayibacter sp. YIM 133350 TaxID=3131992 RepID=UPI00307D82DA
MDDASLDLVEEAARVASGIDPPLDLDAATPAAGYRRGASDAGRAIRRHRFGKGAEAEQAAQLTIIGGTAGYAQVQAEPARASAAPNDFEDVDIDITIPRFGTLDMLRLARFAVTSGWALAGFVFVNGAYQPLAATEASELSERVRAELLMRGVTPASYAVADHNEAFMINALKLRDPDGEPLTISRLGTLHGYRFEAAADLVERFLPEALS